MKLKPEFETRIIDGTQFLIPTGVEGFSGIVRNNRTAAFIVDCLKQETTPEAIVDAMCDEYDAPRGNIAVDVDRIISILRRIGALDE